MMRLIHNIWIGLSTSLWRREAPIIVTETATIFTVSWNWMNLRIESYIFLPQSTALTIELKLSSIKIIAAASLATEVPLTPIAKPTSAFLKAGASLVPSPVTATILPRSLRPVTRQYLSSGRERAKISRLSFNLSNYLPLAIVSTLNYLFSFEACSISVGQSHLAVLHFVHTTPPTNLENSGPSRAIAFLLFLKRPIYFAIAVAVMILSPVTILTVMPALWHDSIASCTSGRGMSLIPTIAMSMRLCFSISYTPLSSLSSDIWRVVMGL